LASLTHPNIIKVRGLPLGGVECIQHNGEGMGYFLVLDRLFDTLSDRIYKHWVHSHNDIPLIKKKKGIQRLLFKNYPNGVRNNNQMNMNRNADLAVRVKVAFDISAALKYLHEKNIIYRDLKPENLGFDVRGDIKLFDLGLVKELHPEAQDHRGNWKLSMAGTPRYMSPECGTYQRYNLSADVYSFSMLLWEMISLKQPFKGFTYSQLKTEIFIDGDRPPLEMIWHKELRSLIKVGWHQNPAKRPSMDAVYDKLRDVYTAIKPGVVNEEEISHNRRRSTYVNFRQLVWKESGEKEGASIHQ
jgi:serine/threonine protein kinase